MELLNQILDSIRNCRACRLMGENLDRHILYVPICPKPRARFMFVGRDPSPRTVVCVGIRDSASAFIRDVFALADAAAIPDELVYVTDMVKCHWRTSRGGKPEAGTAERPTRLPADIAQACVQKWLQREVEALGPLVILAFGEEVYQQMQSYVVSPLPAPDRLSATRDKSRPDAELWFSENGPLTMRLGDATTRLVPLRHAGNAATLPHEDPSDRRRLAYERSRRRAVELLSEYVALGPEAPGLARSQATGG